MPAHLTIDQKRTACRLRARGLSLRQVGREVGRSGLGLSVELRCSRTNASATYRSRPKAAPSLEGVHNVPRHLSTMW